jgi:transposase
VPVVRHLCDEQGAVLEPFFASPVPRPDGRGRPWQEARAVLDGVLDVLRTGWVWADWPESYPPQSSCQDRRPPWIRTGVRKAALAELADELADCGLLELGECFLDGTFAPAQRGGRAVGKTKKGQGSKRMAVVEADGWPGAIPVDRATPQAVKLGKQTLAARFVEKLPERLMGDQASHSEALDADWATQGIEVLAPQRRHRQHKTPEGRPLRRRQRRDKGKRLWAWRQAFRRLRVRCGRGKQKPIWVLALSPVYSSCYGARYDFRFVG